MLASMSKAKLPAFLLIGIIFGASFIYLTRQSSTKETRPTTMSKQEAPKLILDISKIVGKSQDEVKAILGEPTSCENVNPSRVGSSPKCTYNGDQIEIVFINGKADWITVNGLSKLDFSPTALEAFGFSPTSPTFRNDNVIRWANLASLHEVSLFPGQGRKSDYLYVKAITD